MIKPEDLRIGDLVRVCRDCEFSKGTVCVVSEIGTIKIVEERKGVVSLIPLDGNDDSWQDVWCSDIEGIPLTPEILEKNGWKNTKYTPLIYTHNEYGIEFWASLKGIDDGGTVTYHDEELHDIKYVHELQHILWALGLDAELKV